MQKNPLALANGFQMALSRRIVLAFASPAKPFYATHNTTLVLLLFPSLSLALSRGLGVRFFPKERQKHKKTRLQKQTGFKWRPLGESNSSFRIENPTS